MKKQKEYEKKSTTTDTNGNLILIKAANYEKFQNDFSFPKLNVLEKKEIIPIKKIEKKIDKEKENLIKQQGSNLVSEILQKEKDDFMKTTKNLFNEKNNTKNPVPLKSAASAEISHVEKPSILPAGSNFE